MKTPKTILALLGTIIVIYSCTYKSKQNTEELKFVEDNISFAVAQMNNMIDYLPDPDTAELKRIIPTMASPTGKVHTSHPYGWTIGFFPGSLWYMYELTNDTLWRNRAEKWTHKLEYLKTFTAHHDLGFMMYCSYGNANRLAPRPEYKDILVQSAASLATRFYPDAKVIKSWNYRKAWNGTTEWFCPVIIDNMMNLELLCAGTKLSGNPVYKDIAVTHSETTLKNHFRPDFSTYHVVDYDTITGEVKDQATCQGYSDNSTWSRGQAWAIYGYTMMYRETGRKEYLNAACKAADYFINNLPADYVPLWDFNIGQIGYTPEGKSKAVEDKTPYRDVSAGSITCSALFELGQLAQKQHYIDAAVKMLHSLSSPEYRATLGSNGNFLLMHSVSSLPHGGGIDYALDYADYYYLEALVRYRGYLTK